MSPWQTPARSREDHRRSPAEDKCLGALVHRPSPVFNCDVAVAAGILGALIGFAVGVLFVEVIFANNASWPDVVPFALAVLGYLAGRETVRRIGRRRPDDGTRRPAGER
jgi:hypothetical protein